VENLASIRSAQGLDSSVYIPVRTGIADSFHLAEHRQVQLVGGTFPAVRGGFPHVDDARAGKAVRDRQRQRLMEADCAPSVGPLAEPNGMTILQFANFR
jgi:hypothetical protein